jgi:hypothetical protein
MKEKIAKLIDVKSIVTLILTGVFAYLALTGKISKDFLTVYLMIMSFYFGTQYGKNKSAGE